MRILAGQYKGRLIRMPRGIRPTQGKVRKAILDTLGASIGGARCLDLFAGSGAVGFEMLSWGADQITLVERDPRCASAIRENAKRLEGGEPMAPSLVWSAAESRDAPRALDRGSHGLARVAPQVRIMTGDALKAIPQLERAGERFEVIFLDPPYYQGLIDRCLQMLERHAIVSANFHLIAQGFWKEEFPNDFRRFQQEKVVRYGDTALAWYRPA